MNPTQEVMSKREFDDIVDEVMSSSKYWKFNNNTVKGLQSLFDKLKKNLEKWLQGRFDNIDNAEQLSQIIVIVIMILICITIILAIAFLIRYIYKCKNDKNKLKEILGEKITNKTTPQSLREEAGNHFRNKEFRLSIRYSYIALLLLMHEKNILYIENAMTNTEIYNLLCKEKYKNLDVFKELMDTFNYTWYGQNECSDEQYNIFINKFNIVWNEVTAYEKVFS